MLLFSACNREKQISPPSKDTSKPLLIETPKTLDQGCCCSCGGFGCVPKNPTCLLKWTVDMLCSKYVKCNNAGATCQTIRSPEYYICMDCFGAFDDVIELSDQNKCVPKLSMEDLPEEYSYVKERFPELLC